MNDLRQARRTLAFSRQQMVAVEAALTGLPPPKKYNLIFLLDQCVRATLKRAVKVQSRQHERKSGEANSNTKSFDETGFPYNSAKFGGGEAKAPLPLVPPALRPFKGTTSDRREL